VLFITKFSQAISQFKWLNGEKNNVLKAISVLVLKVLRTEMIFGTLVFSLFDHLTWLTALLNFIILSLWESTRSHVLLFDEATFYEHVYVMFVLHLCQSAVMM
jgi:hypothetical protein